MKECRRFPTPQEMHAIEQAARRARAEEFRRLFAVGARKLKALIARGATAFASKVRGTYAPARHGTPRYVTQAPRRGRP